MIDLSPFLEQPRRRWRRADKIVRMIVGHWALGMALGAVLALVWLGFDVLGLRSLMWRSDVAAMATFVFVALFALTFGGVVAATAAMRAGKDDDEPRGGRRAPAFAAARRGAPMSVRFDGRVAIVTGAGGGLGRCHALGLAARGAKVVVNDLGPGGAPSPSALAVAAEIEAAGGVALADGANIADEAQVAAMVAAAATAWGRIDILVNNAGILRDKSFAKMELSDFARVIDVHLMGSAICAKAVWNGMRERNYGRIVFTSSASGLYGNFGQANYGAAKAAMVGLMNVLHLEGAKTNIRVNTLAPTARTAMTENLLPADAAALLAPETVTPGLLFLVSEDAPSRVILGAGAGAFAVTHIEETPGVVYLREGERTPETIAARFAEIADRATAVPLENAFGQTFKFVSLAARGEGVKVKL